MSDDRSETLEGAKGVAPEAKLAILDLGTSDRLDQAMGGTLWETAGGTGARLHSASWGFPDDPCTVEDSSVSFDEWAFEVRRRRWAMNGGFVVIFKTTVRRVLLNDATSMHIDDLLVQI